MTTPAGQISMSDVRLEIWGSGSGQIAMGDYETRQLAGVSNTASVSMSQLKSKTWTTPTWNRAAGSYTNSTGTSVSFSTTSTQNAKWSFIQTGANAVQTNLANNAYGTSFTCSINGGQNGRSGSIQLTCTWGKFTRTWNYTLNAEGNGGASTVTL